MTGAEIVSQGFVVVLLAAVLVGVAAIHGRTVWKALAVGIVVVRLENASTRVSDQAVVAQVVLHEEAVVLGVA